MQEEDEHGCGQEHGRRGALRGRMEGGKGGRWAWRVCYDAMNRMGWRKGGYVDDVVCFLESWYNMIIISNKLERQLQKR